jgi:hypothetical protein
MASYVFRSTVDRERQARDFGIQDLGDAQLVEKRAIRDDLAVRHAVSPNRLQPVGKVTSHERLGQD